MMNVWVEYWKKPKETKYYAQAREAKWVEPDPADISRRFFDKREDAVQFANRMSNNNYYAKIKTDGII